MLGGGSREAMETSEGEGVMHGLRWGDGWLRAPGGGSKLLFDEADASYRLKTCEKSLSNLAGATAPPCSCGMGPSSPSGSSSTTNRNPACSLGGEKSARRSQLTILNQIRSHSVLLLFFVHIFVGSIEIQKARDIGFGVRTGSH